VRTGFEEIELTFFIADSMSSGFFKGGIIR